MFRSLSESTGFDPAEQWGADLFDTLTEADLFFPNEVELAALSGESDPERGVRKLSQGRTRIVAKLGANGSMTVENGEVVHCPALPVQPVDTTGAGDSFNAGFLHAWVRRQPILECLRFGAACGALSTLGMGGTGSQPTEQQAREFIAKGASS